MCLAKFTLETYTKFCIDLSNSYGVETCRETEAIRQLYVSVTRFLQEHLQNIRQKALYADIQHPFPLSEK
jgi:hypothetical protein